jgi:hypothetical protein
MKKLIILLYSSIHLSFSFGQITLTIQGTVVNNTEPGTWEGVNIARSVPTKFTYRNNFITSVNDSGYILQAGDESVEANNNNLEGEIIAGNKFTWDGTDPTSITHGVFTGYNINAILEYNYLNKVPTGLIRKSNGMTCTSGGVAYNIVNKTQAVAVVVKGMNGVNIYNNTFYSDQVMYSGQDVGTWRGLVDVYSNTDIIPNGTSSGTKIKNNIFYTKNQTYNIYIYDAACLTGFESDFNVFYCETGTPVFNYLGTTKTFAQWQALGYDIHSVVVNPNFIDFTDFVPTVRLDVGTDLGNTWQTGLSTKATWTVGVSPETANQNGTWQAGACIYDATSINPYYISSVVENATPTILELTYSLSLANIGPSTSDFNVKVNSVSRTVNSVAIIGSKVRLTLASPIVFGDIISVSYTKPAINPLQTVSGGQADSVSAQAVVNNCTNVTPVVNITFPLNGSSFTAPAIITITANASDGDGTINKVEFYNGSTKLGEKNSAPYSFIWNNMAVGTYSLTAVAIDNSNVTTTSSPVEVNIIKSNEVNTELINLFPNPNVGYFTIEIINPLNNGSNNISIINLEGEKVYDGILLKNEITKQFDLSYLGPGIYILMIVGKEILVTQKLIKN